MSLPSVKASGNPATILVVFKATLIDFREFCKGQIGEIIHLLSYSEVVFATNKTSVGDHEKTFFVGFGYNFYKMIIRFYKMCFSFLPCVGRDLKWSLFSRRCS